MDTDLAALQKTIEEIWDTAQLLGLDPYPTHFEIVPASIMYEFGAYGLPGRFSHWTHGKAYHQMKTMYDYGLSKIYELVINASPAYAFLLEGNSMVQNKLVVAHVLAHCDFFKNNFYFSPTSRQMLESASVNADRIRKYEFQHGRLEVEQCLDAVLSIQEHIDPNVFTRRHDDQQTQERKRPDATPSTPYDDLFNIDKATKDEHDKPETSKKFPEEPQKDVLLFIAEHAAGLKEWQRDVIHIVRSEMLYFLPQMQTKIMNEGWASYWHARILRELDLTSEEYIEFAGLHANVLAPSRRQINPYYVGMKIFEDIERRWDNPTQEEKELYGRSGGEGRQKIFEVRELENDISFLRNYLTRELVQDLDLYIYKLEGDEWKIVEKNWQKVRDTILASMTNFGYPYIVVENGDYHGNRELYLRHSFEGQELDLDYADKTLHYIHQLWGRTVHLETVVDGRVTLLSFDGTKNTKTLL